MAAPTNTSTKRKKLYFPIRVITSEVRVIAFCASTGPNFGFASGDRYGNVMEANRYAGVAAGITSSQRRCKQAITAVFQPSSIVFGTLKSQREVCLDFIAAAGVSTTLPSIDPSTELRPRLRVRLFGGGASGSVFAGTIYVQRQHSIEV